MRVAVTGGSGFIGTHLIARLLSEGHHVIGVDKSKIPLSLVPQLGSNLSWLEIDLSSFGPGQLLLDCDWVFHLAGQTSAEVSMRSPNVDFESNLLGLHKLAEALSEDVRGFTFASSMAVYGDKSGVVTESSSTNPKSLYGLAKLYGELYLERRLRADVSLFSLRLFNVYGPGQDLTRMDQGMLSIYASMLLAGNIVNVKGSTSRVRDFLYVDDAVEALIRTIGRPGRARLNISTNVATTVKDLIQLLAAGLGKSEVEVIELGATLGDVHGFTGDFSAARKELGWKPSVQISAGIAKTINSL